MTETQINHLPKEAISIPDVGVETFAAISPEREQKLRKVLDGPTGDTYGNYESALSLGLIDMFNYDPKTGQDGLVHTLSGEVIVGENEARIPEGFHHEPSGTFGPDTAARTVDRDHLELLNARKRSNYQEHPFEPYQAKVYVAGSKKLTRQTNPKTGLEEIKEARNFMFPKEYDSLTVLQAIRIARQGRDHSNDRIAENGKLVTEGYAPMIDNKSLMQIRLILDPETEKVIAAYPLVKFRGIMKLSEAALRRIEQGEEIE